MYIDNTCFFSELEPAIESTMTESSLAFGIYVTVVCAGTTVVYCVRGNGVGLSLYSACRFASIDFLMSSLISALRTGFSSGRSFVDWNCCFFKSTTDADFIYLISDCWCRFHHSIDLVSHIHKKPQWICMKLLVSWTFVSLNSIEALTFFVDLFALAAAGETMINMTSPTIRLNCIQFKMRPRMEMTRKKWQKKWKKK